jgi:hypothetical protein
MHHTFVRSWFQAALALGFIAVALSTRAEIAAPSRALEPGVGVGYHQGFGPVGAGVPTLQALDPARVQVGADYRLAENFSVARPSASR